MSIAPVVPEQAAGRALIADPSRTVAMMAEAILRRRGWRADRTADPERAFELATTSPYDLLLIDSTLVLPGGQALHLALAPFGPVIALLPSDAPHFRTPALRKPIDPARLIEALPEPEAPLIDRAALAEIWTDLADPVFHQVVALFLGEVGQRRVAIDAAVDLIDRPKLVREAHSLKGGAANVGATRLARAAAALEQAAPNAEPEALRQAASRLQSLATRTAIALQSLLDE